MKNIFPKILLTIVILAGIFFLTTVFQNNKAMKIAFLGDSITKYGWVLENGYVRRVAQGLSLSGIHIKPIPAGISSNTSYDMLLRLDRDVLDKKPDVVFFMGGINDIFFNTVDLEGYKNNVNTIVNKIKQSGAKPIIINITLITEDINTPQNKRIDEYNEFLKEYTTQNNIQFIDINTIFKNELKKYNNPRYILTVDGVHLNDRGHQLLADAILAEFLKNYKH